MDLPINTAIMKHPANWVVITLMVLIAGLALSIFFPEPANGD